MRLLAFSFCANICYRVFRFFPSSSMPKSNVSASLPASVEVDGYTVHKLRLSEYAQVFDKMQKIPELVAQIEGVDTGNVDSNAIIKALPKIIATALPEALDILAVAVRVPKETLDEEMDLKTAIKCFRAMFEVNDFLGAWEEIQAVFQPESPKTHDTKKE